MRDPGAEMVIQLTDALYPINPTASEEFVRLYLGHPPGDSDEK